MNNAMVLMLIIQFSISFTHDYHADEILGKWESDKHDVIIDISKLNNQYFGKVVWFYCEPNGLKMPEFTDTNNPNQNLRNRKWLGMEVLTNLVYKGDNKYDNGEIYDANSGHTYSSAITLTTKNTLTVRGYWGIQLFGRSINFVKI